MTGSYIVRTGALVLPDRVLEEGVLGVSGGRIDYIGPGLPSGAAGEGEGRCILDLRDSVVLPRLVELHIHGAFGCGFESLRSGDELSELAGKLAARGIGCFVPTCLWDEKAVEALVAAIEDSGLPETVLPGIYLEGPFVNPEKRGGIGLNHIRRPDPDLLRHILETTRGRLRLMTLAPELPGAEALFPILEEAGVRICLGHSAASASAPLPRGPFSVTHLFNAMSGLDHRAGGLANLALSGRARWAELNADGIHVNADAVKVASKCLAPASLVLTSDAVVAAGLPYGDYSYFGRKVTSGGSGVRFSDSGVLMGSNRLGMEIVLSFAAASGASLHRAVASMSAVPTELLGLEPARAGGSIALGASDELYAWDRAFRSCRSLRSLAGGCP